MAARLDTLRDYHIRTRRSRCSGIVDISHHHHDLNAAPLAALDDI